MAKKKRTSSGRRKIGCRRWFYIVSGLFLLYVFGAAYSASPARRATATPKPTEIVMVAANVQASITITPPPGAIQGEDVWLVVDEIIAQDGVEDQGSAQNGKLLVFFGRFYSADDRCIYASDIRLILDGEEYPPDRGWMADIQGTLTERLDYPGPIGGHCIDAMTETKTFFVFDVPEINENGSLRFLSKIELVEIDWEHDVRATPTHSVRIQTPSVIPPTATVSRTPTLNATSTPRATATTVSATIRLYTTGSARVRSCASTTCSIVVTLDGGEMIEAIGTESGQAVNTGNAVWYKINYDGQIAYVYSGVLSNSSSPRPAVVNTNAPGVNIPVATQAAGGGSGARPGNCSTAVAMGLSAQEAAKWPHLDRDGDGVACYGD